MAGIDVKNKIVLVTGANRGIGLALVEGFLAAGASKVYSAVRRLHSVDDLVKKHTGGEIVPIYIDIGKPETIHQAAVTANDVDIVVCNAGILDLVEPLSKDFSESLQKQFDLNVFGLVHMSQAFSPILEAKGCGGTGLVQINSTSSLRCPGPKFTGYAASKAAAFAITQGLRASLTNTLVVSVHPGPIATDMVDQFNARHRSEPASQVADAVIQALSEGQFLVYTDTFSKNMGTEYQNFAEKVVLPTSAPPPSS